MNEFELIQQYFQNQTIQRKDVVLGIGDDAAILQIPPQKHLVTTVDTFVENIHFFANTTPEDIAYKALAVNLSDLAAMAAEPAWFTLALTLPTVNKDWLQQFATGLFSLASQYQIQLIGGDTTQGPLSITIQAFGFVEPHQAARRDGAQVGDLIYVTGEVGTAAFALDYLGRGALQYNSKNSAEHANAMQKLLRPTPRVKEALAIKSYLHAAIDISDGLAADLNHILASSHVGTTLFLKDLPISPLLFNTKSADETYRLALSGGDDYELCFTISPKDQKNVEHFLSQLNCPFRQIGKIEAELGLRCVQPDGGLFKIEKTGYQHFD